MSTKFGPKTWIGTLDISTPFGAIDAEHSTPHSGVDIVTSGACLAPFDGIVTRSVAEGDSGGGLGDYFQMVSLDGRFVFTVGHGNANSDSGVRRGQQIALGDAVMADMGRPSTGYSTGPHYHEQLTDNGRLVSILDYLSSSWGDNTQPTSGGWDGVSTLYTGNYPNDGLVYAIHVGETIWDIAASKGVSLDQVRAWTAALAGSKYGPAQLAKSGAGASWWDGSDTYYAGVTFAVSDVVGQLAAEDAKVAAAAEATALQAQEAANASRDANIEASLPETSAESVATNAAALAEVAAHAKAAADDELAAALDRARATLPQVAANAEKALAGSVDANTGAPLSGLFSGSDLGRKRAYLAYSAAALLVSFGPDIVTAGVLTNSAVPSFVAYVSLASSILLKIGTAIGFVAASNTSK